MVYSFIFFICIPGILVLHVTNTHVCPINDFCTDRDKTIALLVNYQKKKNCLAGEQIE